MHKIRLEAEDDTDQHFYAPFRILEPEEIKKPKNLLGELAEEVKAPEAETEPVWRINLASQRLNFQIRISIKK